MKQLKAKQLVAMDFFLYHKKFKPKVIHVKIPSEPTFSDVFNHPCQKWLDKGYYIHIVYYVYQ